MEIENWYIHYRIKYKDLNIDFKSIDDLKIFFANQSNDYFQDFFIICLEKIKSTSYNIHQ